VGLAVAFEIAIYRNISRRVEGAHKRVQPPAMHALAPDASPAPTPVIAPAAEGEEERDSLHAAAASVGTDEVSVSVQPFEARALFLHIRATDASLSSSRASPPSSFLSPTPTDGSASSTEPCRYVPCPRQDQRPSSCLPPRAAPKAILQPPVGG
jgi:hypothetical protein